MGATVLDEQHPAAEKAQHHLRTIVDSLADGIVIVDLAGCIRFSNPAAARLFNRTPAELVGTILGIPLVGGETTEMEIVRRGTSSFIHAELRVVQTVWEGAAAELVSLRDITDRKEAEERSKQLVHERDARLQAETASRTKSDFLAIMSHELRTPLNAILGYSELIELGLSGDVGAKAQEQVARIRSSARLLLGLVNDLLDLAKVEAGRMLVGNHPALVRDAIAVSLPLIEPQAKARGLTIAVAPETASLPLYIGDNERVAQILVNLLSNAVKCTEGGGSITIGGSMASTPELPAQLHVRCPYLRIDVRDTGSGIEPDKLAAIFAPFVQADAGHARSKGGSGLGLTIAQSLARLMGGDLTVQSELGKGSTFTLWLPTEVCTAASAITLATPEVGTSEPASRRTSGISDRRQELQGFGELARGVLSELEPLVAAVVERIRTDPSLHVAAGLQTSQVTDRLSTLLADIAATLMTVDDPAPSREDALQSQRLAADLLGAQRARLGWTEASMRREFMIIREELERVVRNAVPAGGVLQMADALAALNRFIDQAEYVGVRRLARERVE